jgi:hypothetical protein
VDSVLLGKSHQEVPLLGSVAFANELAGFVHNARHLIVALGIDYPASLFVSFLGARGVKLAISEQLVFYRGLNTRPFDRDSVLFRELALTESDTSEFKLIKPLLDELWQAAGLARCLDYDDKGEWHPQP